METNLLLMCSTESPKETFVVSTLSGSTSTKKQVEAGLQEIVFFTKVKEKLDRDTFLCAKSVAIFIFITWYQETKQSEAASLQ